MNALHDVLVEHPEAVEWPDYLAILYNIQSKLSDMAVNPAHSRVDEIADVHLHRAIKWLNLPENVRPRDPAKPRLPKLKPPIDTTGGLPIAD
jgi:hypothetical protein